MLVSMAVSVAVAAGTETERVIANVIVSESESESQRWTDPTTVCDQSDQSRRTCDELLKGAIGPNMART